MPEQDNGGVEVTLDGAHLRVDARPARLVSQLKGGGGGDPVLTARPVDGPAHTESLPPNARRATFRIRDDVTVEATRAADFVAIADETGRCLVVAFSGEVTVVPRGDDRFALGAHEALVVPAGKGEPRVVSTAELTEADQTELEAFMDETADAVLAPPAPPTPATPEPEPKPEPDVKPEPDAKTAPVPVVAAKAAPTPSKTAPGKASPAKKAGAGVPVGQTGGQRRKKGKKGRPQPARPQKTAAAKKAAAPAKAASKVAAAGGGGRPPVPPSRGGGGGGGAGGGSGPGGGGHDDDVYEDTPRDRRFVFIASAGALVVAVVLIVMLTGNNDKGNVATNATTTTEATAATTTTAKPAATTTTAKPAATTTTAKPAATTTTTTAKPAATTTTVATVAPNYTIDPKSCVQTGNSITYTATVTNKASVPFDFAVTVTFKDSSGAQVASADANVTKLGSGRSADFSAKGTSSKSLAGTGASCEVTKVDAHASK
jgi:outer membrane biosynthesis protein TonB